MKVICIDANKGVTGYGTTLVEGKVYNVTESVSHCGHPAYEVHDMIGIVTACTCGYEHSSALFNRKRFVPLSTIDETELLRERESELQSI